MSEKTDVVGVARSEFREITLQEISNGAGYQLAFRTFAELESLAKLMAATNFVAKCLRGKPNDCLVVAMQATRWGMDVWAVASKVYFVNDVMAYEAQLVDAVVNSSGILEERLNLEFSGEGEGLKCKVTGHIKGEKEPKVMEYELRTITTRNAPNWKQQLKQQFGYYSKRAWYRMYTPDILMGVYTPDEIKYNATGDDMIDVTPMSYGYSAKAEKDPATPKPSTLDEMIKTAQSTPEPTVAENATLPFDTGAFTALLDDITTVPTLEGLKYKFDAAVAQFPDAPADLYRRLVAARDTREAELVKVVAKPEMPMFFGKKE